MFQIGEFSKLTQVTIRMLRYYDEVGLLKPAKINHWTGYRMYAVEQISDLNKIIYLRDRGFNVVEIGNALSTKDVDALINQLDMKQLELQEKIRDEQEKLRKIELTKHEILYGKDEMHYNILIKSIPSFQVLSLRKKIPNYYAEGRLWQELTAFATEHQLQSSSNTFAIYHDTEYKEVDIDVELCAPVKKCGSSIGEFTYRHTEPIPMMAYTMVYGSFSNIAGAYKAFAEWLQRNSKYKMSGQTRQIVHRGPWNEENIEQYLIELQIPLAIGEHPNI